MRFRRFKVATWSIAALFALSTLLFMQPPPAIADTGSYSDRSETPIARANPQLSRKLLDSLPASILANSKIRVDPNIPPGTPFLIIDPKGRLSVAAGQTQAQVSEATSILTAKSQALAACRTSAVVPIRVTVTVKSQCAAIIGTTDSVKVNYQVSNSPSTSGVVSWRPEGYKKVKVCVDRRPPLLPLCHYEWRSYWGTGQPSPGTAWVTWGQVAAMPRVKFANGSYTLGWAGTFMP